MAKSDKTDPDAPTADRLRHDIDSGRSGDKVPFPDPSAAPLGTDAEAGGVPNSAEARAQAHRAEVANRRAETDANASAPDDSPIRPPARRFTFFSLRGAVAALLVLIIAVILLWVLLPAAA